MSRGGARGDAASGAGAVDYYREVVLPAVYGALDAVFPEFGFVRDGRGGWVARAKDGAGHGPLGTRPDRVHVRMLRSGMHPAGFGVHGGEPVAFCAWVLGSTLGHPRGEDFLRAAAELARRAGTDPGPLGPGGAKPDPGEMARVRQRIEAQRRLQARQERRRRAERIQAARALWQRAQADHQGVRDYLAGRGVDVDALGGVPRSLRFCPDVELGKRTVPAVIAAVVLHKAGDGGEGRDGIVAVHRIFVREDGRGKNESLGASKMMLGPVRGGAVRLGMPVAGDTLVLCEGIETAAAIRAATGMPVWACLSAGGLLALELPGAVATVVGGVVVAGDLDDPRVRDDTGGTPLRGQQAAAEAAQRLRDLFPGLSVGVALPKAWAPAEWAA